MKISDQLRLENVNVSPSTIRNLWIKEEMDPVQTIASHGRREERPGYRSYGGADPSLEKANPCFRERHVESSYPGYLLCQDTSW